jgi:predicted transcriptional regulator with HTH domain
MADVVIEPEIRMSLRRSGVRRKALKYLVGIYPRKKCASEITEGTERGINEVCGALNGVFNRYKKENSLITFALVKKEKINGMYFYSATESGCRSLID